MKYDLKIRATVKKYLDYMCTSMDYMRIGLKNPSFTRVFTKLLRVRPGKISGIREAHIIGDLLDTEVGVL